MIIKTRKLYVLAVRFICLIIYADRPRVKMMSMVENQNSKPKIQNNFKTPNPNCLSALHGLDIEICDLFGILDLGFEYIAIAPWG